MTDPAPLSAAALFKAYSGPVFRYLLRMTASRARADELTQDTFLRIVRALADYDHRGRERAWVFAIARNVLLNERRGRSRKPDPDSLAEDSTADLGTTEQTIALGQALARLAEIDREAFLLREVAGLDYAEIAALTELSPGAVRNRIYRSRLQLRELLQATPQPSSTTKSTPRAQRTGP